MDKFHVIKNFLTEEECFNILTKYKSEVELTPGKIIRGDFTNIRKSSVGFIDNIEIIDERLKSTLRDVIKIKGYEVTNLERYQFTEYKTGEFYNWHKDSDTIDDYKDRFCSIVIQLNDDYEGGYLELKDENDEITRFDIGTGNLYIFYSNITHRVVPVTNGTRYSLVNWISLKTLENFKKTLI